MSSNNSGGSGGGGGGGKGNFPITITARDVGIDQSITKLTRFADSLRMTGQAVQQSTQMINQFGQSMANFGRGTQQMNQGFGQGSSAANQFNQAISNTINTVRNGQTTMTQYMNTQRQTAQTAQQASTVQTTLTANTQRMNSTFMQTNATLGQAQGNFTRLNQVFQQSNASLGQATGSFTRLNQTFQQTNASLGQATGTIGKVNQTMDQSGDSANKASTNYNRIGESIGNIVQRGTGLFLSFKMFQMAVQESTGMAEMLAAGQENVARLTEKAAQAVERYGENSIQATRANEKLDKATRGLAYTQRNANMAAGDASFFSVMIATNIISMVIPALTNWQNTQANLTKGFSVFSAAMGALPAKISGISAAATGLTTVLSSIPARLKLAAAGGVTSMSSLAPQIAFVDREAKRLNTTANTLATGMNGATVASRGLMATLGPIVAVIAAVGITVAAVATDFMGVRTRLQEFGKAAGDQIPILYPLLEGIQAVGGALGITGESAEQTKTHFENATIGFQNMGVLWDETVNRMQESNNRLVREIGNTAEVLTTDIGEAASSFQSQITATTDTWNKFIDALGRDDYKEATDILIASFEAIPGIIAEIFKRLDTIILHAIEGLANTIGPAIIGVGTELGTRLMLGLQEALDTVDRWIYDNLVSPIIETGKDLLGVGTELGTQLFNGIVEGLAPILNWIQVSVIIPVQGFFNNIATGIQNIAPFIWDKLGFAQFIIWSSTIAKTVGDLIMGVIQWVRPIATEIWNKLQLAGLFNAAYQLGQDIWDQIVKGINDAGAAMQGAIESAFAIPTAEAPEASAVTTPAKPQPVKNETPTQTPSTKFIDVLDGQVQSVSNKPFSDTASTQAQAQQRPGFNEAGNFVGVQPQNPNDYSQIANAFSSTTNKGFSEATTDQLVQNIKNKTQGGASPLETGKANLQKMIDERKDAPTDAIEEQAIVTGAKRIQQMNDMIAVYGNNEQAVRDYGLQLIAEETAIAALEESNLKMQDSLVGNSMALANNSLQGELRKQGILEQEQVLQEMEMGIISAEAQLQKYGQQVKEGTILDLAFTQGQQDQRKALLDSQVEVAKTNGMLQEYAAQIEEGTIRQVAFTQGQQEQRKALLDSQLEIDKTNGVLKEMALQLEEGSIQQVAFTQGQQEITKHYMDMEVETANMQGQFSKLSLAMYDTNTANIEYRNGLAAGRVEAAEHIIQLDNIRGSYEGNREVLINYARSMDSTIDATRMTNDELQNFIDTMSGSPEAISEMVGWLNQLGDSLRSGLHDAFDKGKDEFDDFIESFGDELGIEIHPTVETVFERAAIREEFKSDLDEILGGLAVIIADPDISIQQPALKNFIEPFMSKLKEDIKSGSGPVTQEMFKLYGALEDILKKPLSTTELITSLTTVRNTLMGMGEVNAAKSIDEFVAILPKANQAVNEFGVNTSNLATSYSNLSKEGQLATGVTTGIGVGVAGVGTAAAEADPQMQQFYQTISQFGTIESVMQTIFEVNFPQHVLNGTAAALQHFNQFHLNANGVYAMMNAAAANMFPQIGQHALQVAVKVTTHYNTAKNNADGVLGMMRNSANVAFPAIGQSAFAVATAVTTHYNRARDNAAGVLGQMRVTASTAFTAIGASTVVVATRVTSYFSTARNNATNSMNQIRSAAQAAFSAVGSAAQSAGSRASSAMNSVKSSAQSAANAVSNLADEINGLRNREITITYRIRTVGSAPSGAGQFGLNMQVDKPTHFLAGEGWGKERVKIQPGSMAFVEDFRKEMASKFGQFLSDPKNSNSNQNISINKQSNTGSGGGKISQRQSNSQRSSNGENNYNSQSDFNGDSNVSGIPVPPGIIANSKSRLMRQGDPSGFRTRVVHETPVPVEINIDGSRLVKKLVKLMTEELGMYGSGYYG